MNQPLPDDSSRDPHSEENYSHLQRGPWWWGILAVGVATFTAAAYVGWTGDPRRIPIAITLATAGVVETLVAFAFRWLTISVNSQDVTARFGPLPLFRRTVPISTIEAVEIGKSTFADGWGIHWYPGRGWTYNIWGFGCIELKLTGGRTLRLGSDEPERLASAIGNFRSSLKPFDYLGGTE